MKMPKITPALKKVINEIKTGTFVCTTGRSAWLGYADNSIQTITMQTFDNLKTLDLIEFYLECNESDRKKCYIWKYKSSETKYKNCVKCDALYNPKVGLHLGGYCQTCTDKAMKTRSLPL